jgi:hypothetical protein
MSTLFVNNLNTASGTDITIPTGKKIIVTDEGGLRVPGTVIQVVKAEKLDTASTNSTMGAGFIDTGITCTITPKASNSKILVTVDVALGVTNSEFNYMRVVRNVGGGTYSMISEAATPGSRNAIHGMVFGANQGRVSTQTFNDLDSPATTSAVNYKIQFATGGGGGYVYVGQSTRDTDGASADPRASSRIVLQEIAQ